MVFAAYMEDGLAFSSDDLEQRQRFVRSAGPKGAPPAIPPIIINPFTYQSPSPAIDPRITPLNPPLGPPPRPAMSMSMAFC